VGSKDVAVATRKLSETALSKLVHAIPELVGGSADLTGSNLTRWKDAVDFQPVILQLPLLFPPQLVRIL
jgi:transketolase